MTEQTLSYNPNAPDVVLHEHCEAIQSRFLARHENALVDIDALYHYTTAEGFQSILSGRSFWATHISHLNDSSELEYGRDLFAMRLSVLKDKWENEFVSRFADRMKEQLDFPGGLLFQAYVVCFCTNGNLLSQWRGYGSGGGGYSIGVSPHKKTDAQLGGDAFMLDEYGKVHLRQVIYDPVEQVALFDELLEGIVNVVAQHGPSMHREEFREKVLEHATMRVQMALADLLPCFKSPSFSEEQEYRYIYFPHRYPIASQRFRIRSGSFVPYVPLNLLDPQTGPLRVSQVYCGPTLNANLTMFTVGQLVESLRHNDVDVRWSDIPLRF
ncbi:DUF2971 domain-containing protein [Paraburkholderia sediminicola]|uniref:DUF2971 domain-containing protein n=1 Tax=Paraburkholderia sediminicola TaxID=458836 RepID=UPI0038BB114C